MLNSMFAFMTVIVLLLGGPWAAWAAWGDKEWEYFEYYENFEHEGNPEILNNQEFTKITRTYGPLVVREGEFKSESLVQPWPSWWYPLYEATLFQPDPDDGPSTLERYDEFVTHYKGENPRSAEYEAKEIFDHRAAPWAGRCDAWSLASILVPEPQKPVTLLGVTFRVRDLKALAIKSYERVEGLSHFGQRFDGLWDNVYSDVFPDQFHRFIQGELFEKNLPFIMDHDAGLEVWNTSVYKAQTRLQPDPENPSVFHVTTWLFSPDPHMRNLDVIGIGQPVVRTYTYDLFGIRLEDGSFKVSRGEWTNASRWDHPDFLISYPKDLAKRTSMNPKIQTGIVDYILKSASARQ